MPPSPARDDIELITSELGANAVVHTASGKDGGQFEVDVTWAPVTVRVAVRDSGGTSRPRVVHGADGQNQRGLEVVDGLGADWGFTDEAGGRIVWADYPWASNGGHVPSSVPSELDVAAIAAKLAAWFPDVPVWCGLTGWLALDTFGDGSVLVAAASPVDLGQMIASSRAIRPVRGSAYDVLAPLMPNGGQGAVQARVVPPVAARRMPTVAPAPETNGARYG